MLRFFTFQIRDYAQDELVREINKQIKGKAKIKPISKNTFDNIKRPKNSALKTNKVKTYFSFETPNWQDSLNFFNDIQKI